MSRKGKAISKESNNLEVFSDAPVPKAVLKNVLPAMGAAKSALVVNLSRQGLIYIPAVFLMQAMLGINGLAWAQLLADVLSLVLVAVLYIFIMRKMKLVLI